MDNLKTPPQWQVLGKSIRGASHERKGLENQDHIDYTRGPDGELPLCLAISDGHGSKNHFRSAIGSRLAVEKAL
ncbi:MAG TPA: protein phosphatase 2C domain-containing protein, partial [Methylococcales bacterium]